MGLFGKDLWEQITVNLDKKTFSLTLTEQKTVWLMKGKIELNEPCARGFSLNGKTLVYTPMLSNLTFSQVVEAFKKMLKENE